MKTDVKDFIYAGIYIALVTVLFAPCASTFAHEYQNVTAPAGGKVLDVTSPHGGGISAPPITLDVTQAFQIIHIQKIELDKKEYLLNIHRYRKEAIKKEIELLKLVLHEDSNESKILDRFLEILGE
jgi:hypothetical protein